MPLFQANVFFLATDRPRSELGPGRSPNNQIRVPLNIMQIWTLTTISFSGVEYFFDIYETIKAIQVKYEEEYDEICLYSAAVYIVNFSNLIYFKGLKSE